MDLELLRQMDMVSELISPESSRLDDDFLICECCCVSAGDIREVCAQIQNVDLNLVQEKTNLGHGCQGCIRRIDNWFSKIF